MEGQYTDEQLEQDVAAKGLTAPRITPEDISDKIVGEYYHQVPGTTVTVCILTLENGYHVIGHSAAASPENFDEAIGRKLAWQHAHDKIWALEGYLLRQRIHESSWPGTTRPA